MNHLIVGYLCVSLCLAFQSTTCAQSTFVEAPTIVLNPTDGNVEVVISLNSTSSIISSLTFSVTFDSDVIQFIDMSDGFYNPIQENKFDIAFFEANGFDQNSDLTTISFDVLGKPGNQSPITIELLNIFDEDNNDVMDDTGIINGMISIACPANPVYGCTNDKYAEYDPTANCDDGSCQFLLCQDPDFQKVTHFNQSSDMNRIGLGVSEDGRRIVMSEGYSELITMEAQAGGWIEIAPRLSLGLASAGRVGYFDIDKTGSRFVIRLGNIKTYDLSSGGWVQVGQEISPVDDPKITLSPDGNKLLVKYANSIEVYEWNNSNWTQVGNTIMETAWYQDLSDDGNRIVVSHPSFGYKVYDFDGIDWTQLGNEITTDINNPQSCKFVFDGKTVLLAHREASQEVYIRCFEWNGSAWTQKGNTVLNEELAVQATYMNISGDGSTVGLSGGGNLYVYKWNGNEWGLSQTLERYDEGFYFNTYDFSFDGSSILSGGYVGDEDNPRHSTYYANGCSDITNLFCVDTQLLNGLITSGTYQSGNRTNAYGTINRHSEGDVIIESENNVNLLPGFKAEGAVNFEVRIVDCNQQ